MAAKIYYDGECPFCTRYVGMIHLRDAVGQVDLIDLREDADIRAQLASEGFDLDQGMVVDLDGNAWAGRMPRICWQACLRRPGFSTG